MEQEGFLPILDAENNLLAVVRNDIKRRSQIFYLTKEANSEDVAEVLKKISSPMPEIK